jgi:hypothetical protein
MNLAPLLAQFRRQKPDDDAGRSRGKSILFQTTAVNPGERPLPCKVHSTSMLCADFTVVRLDLKLKVQMQGRKCRDCRETVHPCSPNIAVCEKAEHCLC